MMQSAVRVWLAPLLPKKGHFMNRLILILLLPLTTFLCSCEEDEYTIEMRPVGQGLERKLSVARYERTEGTKDRKSVV